MPYKSQDIKLPRNLDRRVKVTEEDKENIRSLYKKVGVVREVARQFEHICSRRMIQFILFPERLSHLSEMHRKAQHWKTYFNRKQLTTAVRNLRHYKHNLHSKGLI